MAGRVISPSDLKVAIAAYCSESGSSCSESEGGKFRLMTDNTPKDDDPVIWIDAGKIQDNRGGDAVMDIISYLPKAAGPAHVESPKIEDHPIKQDDIDDSPISEGCIYDKIIRHFGPDLLEVFGETGTMKSKGMVALALECAKSGKRVFYFDTENNLSPRDVAALRAAGATYKYTPVLSQIDELIERTIPSMKCDLIIVDSVGMPVLRKFSSMSAKDRGDALLDIIKWLGTLKEWTFNNNALAFVTNQPQSEFGKSNPREKGDYRMPFGDKSNFIPGALLLSKKTLDSPNGSKAVFQVFRLRDHAWGEPIFMIEASKSGTSIKMVPA